ncbi:C-type lectin domain family 4 member E-like [Anableps anableps]
MNVEVNQQEGDEEAAVRGEAAASQDENPTRTSKLPSERVVLLVLGPLLAAALIVIFRLSFDKIRTNQTVKTLKEENEALRKHISDETCLTCEAGWEQQGGNCYYFSTSTSTWTESRRSCVDLGGDLVKIDSREEQVFLQTRLRDVMKNDEDKFWIGLTDSEEEGTWLWVDGSPLNESLKFWTNGEPDNRSLDGAVEADCVRMGKKGDADALKSWFDASCNYPQKSMCERAAGQRSCVCLKFSPELLK